MNRNKANNAAAAKLSPLSTLELVEMFERSHTSEDRDIATVRGWIMDALENRDSVAFDLFVESCEDSPRQFFYPRILEEG